MGGLEAICSRTGIPLLQVHPRPGLAHGRKQAAQEELPPGHRLGQGLASAGPGAPSASPTPAGRRLPTRSTPGPAAPGRGVPPSSGAAPTRPEAAGRPGREGRDPPRSGPAPGGGSRRLMASRRASSTSPTRTERISPGPARETSSSRVSAPIPRDGSAQGAASSTGVPGASSSPPDAARSTAGRPISPGSTRRTVRSLSAPSWPGSWKKERRRASRRGSNRRWNAPPWGRTSHSGGPSGGCRSSRPA